MAIGFVREELPVKPLAELMDSTLLIRIASNNVPTEQQFIAQLDGNLEVTNVELEFILAPDVVLSSNLDICELMGRATNNSTVVGIFAALKNRKLESVLGRTADFLEKNPSQRMKSWKSAAMFIGKIFENYSYLQPISLKTSEGKIIYSFLEEF